MIYIFVILVLTILNGFFAMSEAALVSARKTRLHELLKTGKRSAETAIRLSENPERVFSTVQLGITLIGIVAGAFGASTMAEELTPLVTTLPLVGSYAATFSLAVVVIGITFVSIVLGELIPKRIAIAYPARISVAVAPTMDLLSRLLYPFVWFLNMSSTLVLRACGFRERKNSPISEEEIHIILAQGAEAGVLSPGEQSIATRALQLGDRRVDSIMTPRRDVAWLEWNSDMVALLAKLADSQHSYYPVGEGGIEKLKGMISAKSLWALSRTKDPNIWRNEITQPLCVPGTTNILRLLDLFRRKRTRGAIVIDEYGSVDGMVTLTDILSVLIGDIPDENDIDEDTTILTREDGTMLVSGSTPIVDLEHKLHLNLRPIDTPNEYQTVAGFVLSTLGHVPTVTEKFNLQHATFEVVDMDGVRVDKILVTLTPVREEVESKKGQVAEDEE